MPLVLADRVNETTTTTSTGTLTLAGAVSGYQSFAVIGNGNTTYYTIVHQTANEWEVGIGTYTSSGTTLARNTVLASSNSGSLVNFSAGTKFVFCDYPAGRAVYLDTATNVTIPGLTLSGGTANGVLYLNGSKVATSGSGLTFNGTTLVSPDITDSSLTSGRVTYAGTGGNFVDSANLTFNGTTLVAADFTDSSLTSGRVVFSGAGGNLSDSSSLTWNGTGLGIGVSSASSLLHIAGATPLLIVNQSSGTSTKLSIREGGSEYAYIDSSNSTGQLRLSIGPNAPWGGVITFVTNTSERARISAAGNLLLGTTTVAYANTLLNIGSTSDVENGVQITTSTTGSGYILFGDGSAGAAYVGQVKYTHTDNSMSFWTNGTIKTTLTSAGNFGIGTASPTNTAGFSRQLQIEGTTAALTLSGTTGTGKYTLGVPGANACGLWDNTASAYRWYVDSSGNLGIGTTSPISAVGGSVTAAGVFAASGYLSAHQTSKGILEWNANITRIRSYGATASTGVIAFNIGGGGGSADSEGMRLDSSGNLGLGVTPSAWSGVGGVFEIKGNAYIYSATGVLSSGANAFFNGTNWIYKTTQAATRYEQVNGQHQWSYAASGTAGNAISFTQAMTLDASGNLGIGTASPVTKLNVASAAGSPTGVSVGGIRVYETTNNYGLNIGGDGTYGYIQGLRGATSTTGYNDLVLQPNSGNLGLGVTPSASWYASSKAMQIGTAGAPYMGLVQQTITTADGYMLWGARLSGDRAFQYTTTGDSPVAYRQNAGTHTWHTAASGTAGNAVSFTQAMTLDASGNLGIGTTTNALTNALTVYRTGSTQAAMAAGNSNTGLNGTLFGVDTTGNGIINQTQALPLIFSTSNTERMRLTSAGRLGIATSIPEVDLQVGADTSTTRALSVRYSSVPLYLSGGFDGTNALSTFSTNAYANATGSGQSWTSFSNTGYGASAIQLASFTTGADIRFLTAAAANTNPTERARINANGQFAASTSLAGSNLVSFNNSSATGYGISITVNNNSSGTYRFFEGVDSGPTQRIAIYTNGDVKNTNGVFAAFSDVKLKKDIVDAGSQWDDIKALRVRKYKLKDDAESVVQIGLIAQEVEQVSPGLVNESQDETKDEDGQIVLTGEVTKGVKYSILYMKAVKALQEAMARIETLEAKVTALESK